jgi:hypothetical protein
MDRIFALEHQPPELVGGLTNGSSVTWYDWEKVQGQHMSLPLS